MNETNKVRIIEEKLNKDAQGIGKKKIMIRKDTLYIFLFYLVFCIISSFLECYADIISSGDTWASVYAEYASGLITVIALRVFWALVFTVITLFIKSKCEYIVEPFRKSIKEIGKKEKLILIGIIFCFPVIWSLIEFLIYGSTIIIYPDLKSVIVMTLANITYDGVLMELWCRCGLFLGFLFVVKKIFVKKNKKIDKKILIPSMIIISLVVFMIQLLFLTSMKGLTAFMVLRAFFIYFGYDLLYSYIFVRYGLKWSTIANVCYLFMFVGLCPIIL